MVNACLYIYIYIYTGPRNWAQKSLYLVQSWAASLRKSIHRLTRPSEASRRFSTLAKGRPRKIRTWLIPPVGSTFVSFFLFHLLFLLPSSFLIFIYPISRIASETFYSIFHLSLVDDIFVRNSFPRIIYHFITLFRVFL